MQQRYNGLREHLAEAGIRGEAALILELRQLERLKWAEIGARLELKPTTVRDHYYRANRLLIHYRRQMGVMPDEEAVDGEELSERADIVYQHAVRGPGRGNGRTPPLPVDPRSTRTGIRGRVMLLEDVREICRGADERRAARG